ncbi:MAG: carbonic anhydrase family protein [Gammaproteobacteria bacterium]|nr:carbonic anhydrase family protein [Gammaproteobacteria bacterium]
MRRTLLTLLGSIILTSGTVVAGEKTHWEYTGDSGPKNWGTLDEKFKACATGRNQSPIDLNNFIEADLKTIDFNYTTQATEILNNGHTIQANYAPGSKIKVDGIDFELKQFHFHTPSENHIEGQSFPMEAHLVHADSDGNLAVIAIMFSEGENNAAIGKLWSSMPEHAGDKQSLKGKVSAIDLLPKDHDYYRFNGSLTTPPCTEGVRWLVMKNPVNVSKEQVKTFSDIMHHANNRPIQGTFARPVLK